jgi:hypothetical protein
MEIKIDEDTLKSTIKCEKDFSCLKGQNEFCKIEYCVSDVYFGKCKEHTYCIYKRALGDSFFCSCPTRKEIYSKYKL